MCSSLASGGGGSEGGEPRSTLKGCSRGTARSPWKPGVPPNGSEGWSSRSRSGDPRPGPYNRLFGTQPRPVSRLRPCAWLPLAKTSRTKGSAIVLRRSRLLSALSVVMATIVLVEWAELCAVTLLQHGHVVLKCFVLAVVTAMNLVMWRGWSLWCGRPERVVKRWGALLEQSCKNVRHATLTPLSRGKPSV